MNTKKTTFNRKGLINETANVKELREMRILYYTCLANALRESADDEEIVRLTARACRQSGLPEEPCVMRTIDSERICLDVDSIRKIFRAAYIEKGVKPRSALNQKERIARDEEQRMELHNQQFQLVRKADLVLTDYFEPVERNKDDLMTFPEIEQSLRSRVGAGRMPTLSELSTALAYHFQTGAVKGRRGWYMRIRQL